MRTRRSFRASVVPMAMPLAVVLAATALVFRPAVVKGQTGRDLAPVPVATDGTRVTVDTTDPVNFVFDGTAGQRIAVRSNRSWTGVDPLNEQLREGKLRREPFLSVATLELTGKYQISTSEALRAPVWVEISTLAPATAPIITKVGEDIIAPLTPGDPARIVIPVRGGQRYRLTIASQSEDVRVCASERGTTRSRAIGLQCLQKSGFTAATTTFVPLRDHQLQLEAVGSGDAETDRARLRIDEAPNDVVITPDAASVAQSKAPSGAKVLVPFWGSAADGAVVSSPNGELVRKWGEAFVDREGELKVSAVPVTFSAEAEPFVSWTDEQRVAIFRGEDTPIPLSTDGKAVKAKNKPWFATIGAMELREGRRYEITVAGTNIRPIGLAFRDPNGRFSAEVAPWTWDEDEAVAKDAPKGSQRATTQINVRHGGRWALEVRPKGNTVAEIEMTLTELPGRIGFEPVIDVKELLQPGESADVELAPNEWARFEVQMKDAAPQVLQPSVFRYRNRSFQPTAVDISLWDPKGRLVWANIKNLEEEVLSGRLGREPSLRELFAVLSSTDKYQLIIDPHGDLAGRFRVSVASTALPTDVPLIVDQPVPVLVRGTATGVIDVKDQPRRVRVDGVDSCINASTSEWIRAPVCLRDGQSATLPPGVHRVRFAQPVTAAKPVRLTGLPDGNDELPVLPAAIGDSLTVPSGGARYRFSVPRAGMRLDITPSDAILLGPGDWEAAPRHGLALPVAGTYELSVAPELAPGAPLVAPVLPTSTRTPPVVTTLPSTAVPTPTVPNAGTATPSRTITIKESEPEVLRDTLVFNGAPKVVDLDKVGRVELTIRVPAGRGFVNLDQFTTGNARVVYVADESERRLFFVPFPTRRDSTYRIVITGTGQSRISVTRARPGAVRRPTTRTTRRAITVTRSAPATTAA